MAHEVRSCSSPPLHMHWCEISPPFGIGKRASLFPLLPPILRPQGPGLWSISSVELPLFPNSRPSHDFFIYTILCNLALSGKSGGGSEAKAFPDLGISFFPNPRGSIGVELLLLFTWEAVNFVACSIFSPPALPLQAGGRSGTDRISSRFQRCDPHPSLYPNSGGRPSTISLAQFRVL